MSNQQDQSARIRTTAGEHQCANCPPGRVYAWGCVQGAGVEEIIICASLALDSKSWSVCNPASDHPLIDRALMESYS